MFLRQHLQQVRDAHPEDPDYSGLDKETQRAEKWWREFRLHHPGIALDPNESRRALIDQIPVLMTHLAEPLATRTRMHTHVNEAMALTTRDLHRVAGPEITLTILYEQGAIASRNATDIIVPRQLIAPWLNLVDYLHPCKEYNGQTAWPTADMATYLDQLVQNHMGKASNDYTGFATQGIRSLRQGWQAGKVLVRGATFPELALSH